MEAGIHRIYIMILHNRVCTLLGKRICCQQKQVSNIYIYENEI